MNEEKLKKIFNESFQLYKKLGEKKLDDIDICGEIYNIAQKSSNIELCYVLSHVIVECIKTPVDYDIYQVMKDYYNVMKKHLYDNHIMTDEEWHNLTSSIKEVYAKYQSKYVSNLGLAILDQYEKEQDHIKIRQWNKQLNQAA